MSFTPRLIKEKYKKLSVLELEKKYEDLKRHYCFNSKEEQIDYIIKYYLDASHSVNINSTKIALEELLKEKSGKDYSIEPKRFEINLLDIINFLVNSDEDPFWYVSFVNFFNNVNNVSEKDKISFLIQLVQDRNMFNEFSKEILKTQNVNEIYDKYRNEVRDFISSKIRKG